MKSEIIYFFRDDIEEIKVRTGAVGIWKIEHNGECFDVLEWGGSPFSYLFNMYTDFQMFSQNLLLRKVVYRRIEKELSDVLSHLNRMYQRASEKLGAPDERASN